MSNVLILFSSSSVGTGSEYGMADSFDMGLMVRVPSGSYGTSGVKLVARLAGDEGLNGNGTSSFFDISAFPISGAADTRQITITTGGLYYYPNVGGLRVKAQCDGNGGNTLTITANALLKR